VAHIPYQGTGVTVNFFQAKSIDVKHEKVYAPSLDNASWTIPKVLTFAILYLLSDETSIVNGVKIPLFGPCK
jgi:hypothetical protein